MRKAIITAIAAAMLLTAGGTAFSGTAEQYADAVDFVTEKGIMEGGDNGDLRLEDPVTRAEFTKMLICVAGNPEVWFPGSMSFKDVPQDHWAYEYIYTACMYALIDGYSDTEFGPEDNITYNQALTIILRTCGIFPYLSYPYDYVSIALDSGMLTGVNYSPEEAATRADVAQMIYNTVQCVEHDMIPDAYMFDVGYGLFQCKEIFTGSAADRGGGGGGGASASKPTVGASEPIEGHGGHSGSMAPGVPAESTAGSGGSSGSMAPEIAPSSAADSAIENSSVIYNPYHSNEDYTINEPNSFRQSSLSPLSTFSIDIDTASYANMRRFISGGKMPQSGSVRTEELINYFSYEAPECEPDVPFGVKVQLTDCPWSENKLARITMTGKEAPEDTASDLVFLVDVSGSMSSSNKLPMLKKALCMMLDNLKADDTVAIVTYASGTTVALEPTSCGEREKIEAVIDSLVASGSTNGADGLKTAYDLIEKRKQKETSARIVLCSDGDFNVGPSSVDELKTLITEKRKAGIYLTTMGFGMGNYKDDRMELLADCGNGSYYYIDNMREAKRVFADELPRTICTVAEDVKLQVEFNPAVVGEYRLVGYENRILNAEDFKNDAVDAGELNAGAGVTAIYELVMNGAETENNNTEYRYQTPEYKNTDEVLDVKIRYKNPGGGESILKEYPIKNEIVPADNDTKFAAAAAMLGLKLNGVIDIDYDEIIDLAKSALPVSGSYDSAIADRWEFLQLTELLKYIDR